MKTEKQQALAALDQAVRYIKSQEEEGQAIVEEFATCNIGQLRRALEPFSDGDALYVTFEGKTYCVVSVGSRNGSLFLNFGEWK